jgi:hypothetical protein
VASPFLTLAPLILLDLALYVLLSLRLLLCSLDRHLCARVSSFTYPSPSYRLGNLAPRRLFRT